MLEREIVSCRRCPRLVAWREEVARVKRAAFADQEYWGRPLPGLRGSAPRRWSCSASRRPRTAATGPAACSPGDRSGDWLFAALWRAGFANQPESVALDDGLRLTGCWVGAAVRCAPPANKPTPVERDTCLPFFVRELELLRSARVIVCLGAFAWDAALRALGWTASPSRARGRASVTGPRRRSASFALLGCYHPSQQNTFTGRLTEPMLDAVFARARGLALVAREGQPLKRRAARDR